MKCPNCNAVTDEKICPFCGNEMPKPKPKKSGCPRCGSENIGFRRESMGSRGKSASVKITKGVRVRSGGSSTSYRTVGLCQDCGYAWSVGNGNGSTGKPWWFWLLMIYIWPFWLSWWFWKTDKINLPKKTKGIILGSVWAVLLIIFIISGLVSDTSSSSEKTEEITPVVNETVVENTTDNAVDNTVQQPENNSEFNITELPVMNGTGTERIGTYSMCYMLSADCTDEILVKWYKEIKDKGYNWNIIRFSDFAGDDNLGVYGNNGVIEKNVVLADDGSIISTDNEIVYTYDSDNDILIPFDNTDSRLEESLEEASSIAYATDTVKVRQQPNTDCDVLDMVKPGAEVTVLGTEGDWSKVSVGGVEGYIKSEFLTTVAPTNQSDQQSSANSTGNNVGNPDEFSDYVPTGAPTGMTIVNRENGKIHDAGCSKLPDEDNRIYYNSVQEALDAGFSDRCGICHPR